MALDNDQIRQLVNHEFENSIGIPGSDITEERARAYDYYLRKLYGWEEEGDSKIVTSEVSDVVDGQLTSLMRIFSSEANLVEFEPQGQDDVAAAQQESEYLRYWFFKRNPAFEILFFWCFDALVQKVGYVKQFWDDFERTTVENYEGLSDLEALDLMDDDELEPVEREERFGEYADPQSGQLVEGTVHDIKFRRTKKRGAVCIENVPPEEMRISKDARHLDPGKARMVGQEREDLTRQDLLDMGFDKKKVMELPAITPSIDSSVKAARRDKSDDQTDRPSSVDKSQELVGPFREAYMTIEGDLKQIFICNDVLLEVNDIDRQPFHALCPHPLPHKHVGEASAEKIMDLQLSNSTLIRQIMMNLYHTNNPGKTVWEQAMSENTMSDLLTRRVGRVVRVRRPVGEAVMDDVVPFTAKESFPMVEYFDKKKAERSGVSMDTEGLSPDALKNIQQSVMAEANDIKRMKVELIARIFAETGIKSLFLHMHELLLKHQNDTDVVRLTDGFVPVSPKHWQARYDMTAVIGLGIANRDRNLVHLNAIWEKQGALMEADQMNLTVTPKNLFNTAAEIVRNANIGKPVEMFFTDPGNQSAPPPTDQQIELQKQQLQVQQMAEQNKQQKNQLDLQKLQLDAQEQQLRNEREIFKLQEQREARLDKLSIANEQLRNELHKQGIELTIAQADQVLKKITTQAQAEQMVAGADQSRALAEKARAEARMAGIVDESDNARKDAETLAKVRKTDAEIARIAADVAKTEAEIDKIDADIDKLESDKRATDIEIEAAEKGINEMLEEDESGDSGTEQED
jgi:hypothetical protein